MAVVVSGAAGEALEAELNKAGPGSCTFITCDVSKEEDIKVKFTWSVSAAAAAAQQTHGPTVCHLTHTEKYSSPGVVLLNLNI